MQQHQNEAYQLMINNGYGDNLNLYNTDIIP